MTHDEIKALILLVNETGIAELEVQRGDNKVRIRRGGASSDVALSPVTPLAPPQAPAASTTPTETAPPPPATQTPSGPEPSLITVKSPIVGTYYDSPSPGAPPFVKVGDTVQSGQVLCIIESMKLMNEIEAEVSGVVVSKLVENGRPVEYGQSLFTVRPR